MSSALLCWPDILYLKSLASGRNRDDAFGIPTQKIGRWLVMELYSEKDAEEEKNPELTSIYITVRWTLPPQLGQRKQGFSAR